MFKEVFVVRFGRVSSGLLKMGIFGGSIFSSGKGRPDSKLSPAQINSSKEPPKVVQNAQPMLQEPENFSKIGNFSFKLSTFFQFFYPIDKNSLEYKHQQLLDFPNPLGTTNNRRKWMHLNFCKFPHFSFLFFIKKFSYRQTLGQCQALSPSSSSQYRE